MTNVLYSITCRFYIEVYEGPLAVDKKCSTLCNPIKRRRADGFGQLTIFSSVTLLKLSSVTLLKLCSK